MFDNVFLGSPDNTVQGNYIGTNATGTAALGGQGVALTFDSGNCLIGGTGAGEGNLISGNAAFGIQINSDDNTVCGNFIGTNAAGTGLVPNVGAGVSISGGSSAVTGNLIGGAVAGA